MRRCKSPRPLTKKSGKGGEGGGGGSSAKKEGIRTRTRTLTKKKGLEQSPKHKVTTEKK